MPLLKKEHVVDVFLDLEKAYDTTWRYGILKDIHKHSRKKSKSKSTHIKR